MDFKEFEEIAATKKAKYDDHCKTCWKKMTPPTASLVAEESLEEESPSSASSLGESSSSSSSSSSESESAAPKRPRENAGSVELEGEWY